MTSARGSPSLGGVSQGSEFLHGTVHLDHVDDLLEGPAGNAGVKRKFVEAFGGSGSGERFILVKVRVPMEGLCSGRGQVPWRWPTCRG